MKKAFAAADLDGDGRITDADLPRLLELLELLWRDGVEAI